LKSFFGSQVSTDGRTGAGLSGRKPPRGTTLARNRLATNSPVWHLVCQKTDCQGKTLPQNAENKVMLTFWHLVCQKSVDH
jgi:hypothetical protein